MSLGAIFMALGLSASWGATEYSGAGGNYPLVLGLLLALLGGGVAARAMFMKSNTARELVDAPDKLIITIVVSAIYVALVVILGFYTASLVLMLALPFSLGFRRLRYMLTVAVIFVVIVFLVFSVLLEKPLPREWLLTVLG